MLFRSEGMYQHFKAIAECTDIPQILYNVPGRTGSDLLPETIGRLAKISNIVGIKEATDPYHPTQVTHLPHAQNPYFQH